MLNRPFNMSVLLNVVKTPAVHTADCADLPLFERDALSKAEKETSNEALNWRDLRLNVTEANKRKKV